MPPKQTPRILQVDADAFFVQVARLTDPEGAGRAEYLLVGGSPEGRGVVTSASYSARPCGVHSAMPMATAVRLCPQAMVVPVPRRACSQKSRAIVHVLERFTPAVEPASIDEMYLDLTGTEALYHGESLLETATRIRTTVLEETAITVSIGGGTTRLIAKLAAGRAKPHPDTDGTGVLIVPPGDETAFMRQLALADIPGIGPRFQERLARFGLRTVPDALRYEREVLQEWLGDGTGGWMYDRIRGIGPATVGPREEAKSISRDETFPTDIDDNAMLKQELLQLVDRATTDLRRHGYAARTITVRIRDHDFTTRQASRTLPESLISDRAVYVVARELLAKLRKARHVPARLLGVALSHFGGAPMSDQLALFDTPDAGETETARDRTISEAIDTVRDKFGRDALTRGRPHKA